ncbi:hypothetical protein RUM44_009297 [Polyplax serrata]|uniref:Uncharacterized protein n=1 Tax=Polyplax serrata TaxID=468196 RepID=A0ABR1ASB0_POLSC
MDVNDSKPIINSVSVGSEVCEARCCPDDYMYLTPVGSPAKEGENANNSASSILRLTCPSSSPSVMSSDIGSQQKNMSKQESYFLLPPPYSSRKSSSSSKPLLSESPSSSLTLSDCDEFHSPRPESSQNYLNQENSSTKKIQFSPRKIISTSKEPFHLLQPHSFYPSVNKTEEDPVCTLTFISGDETDQETEHVLKKYTKSPEFLQLKDSVSADEINEKVDKAQKALRSNPSEATLLKDIINVPRLKNRPRNNSLVNVDQKQELLHHRNSSLDSLNAISGTKLAENPYGSLREPKRNKFLNITTRKSSLDSLNSVEKWCVNPLHEFHQKEKESFVPPNTMDEDKGTGGTLHSSQVKLLDQQTFSPGEHFELGKCEKNPCQPGLQEPLFCGKKSGDNSVEMNGKTTAKTQLDRTAEKALHQNNLQILEPMPVADATLSGKSSSPYDLSKLKKPSSRLVDILEYCKKNSRGRPNVSSPVKYVSHVTLLPGEESASSSSRNLVTDYEKSTDPLKDDLRQTLSNNFGPFGSREKRKNFACCIQQSKDSEFAFTPLENESEKDLDVSCGSVKKMFSTDTIGSVRRKSKGKNKEKDIGKRKIKEAKSSSTENEKGKQKIHRLDQSYCDLLKQLHDEMQKQRAKMPKKQLGRLCRSDPPRITKALEKNSSKTEVKPLGSGGEGSGAESFYDFNFRSQANTTEEECSEFDCEPYSKRPQPKEKAKLERMESFYDNKMSTHVKLERIESLYENQKKTPKSEDSCDSEVRNYNTDNLDVPFFPDCESEEERVSPPKPLMTFLPSEWWPVVDAPKTNLAWDWRPPEEVRYPLGLIWVHEKKRT